MVRFELSIGLQYQVLQPSDFVFNFHPAQTPFQRVSNESLLVLPYVKGTVRTDSVTGNRYLRLHAGPGPIQISYSAVVDLEHQTCPGGFPFELPISEVASELLQYVYSSRYCQSDSLPFDAVAPFLNMVPGYGRVQAIANWVRERTRFQIGTTTSKTTALDTYRDRVGVCRDFAHLMIAICRALNIPARFATSIDYGADPALGPTDFHAYVEAFLGDRWYIFDPTGISPTTGLLRIGVGRDAGDAAFATIFGGVISGMPMVVIRALSDDTAGIYLPQGSAGPVSTDDRPLLALSDLSRVDATQTRWASVAESV